MAGVVDKLLAERADNLSLSPVAVREATDVRAAYAALSKALGATPSATQEITQNADSQRTTLEKLLPALTGPLQSHARKTANANLLAVATLRSKQLEKLRPPQLRDLVVALLEHATTHAKALEDYGFDKEVRQKFDDTLAAFSATVGTTQELIDKRQLANASADDLLAELMQQVYELDQPMEIFRVLNPELHSAYRLARRVGKSGSRGTSDEAPQA